MLDGVHELWTAFHELSGDGQREWLLKVLQELKTLEEVLKVERKGGADKPSSSRERVRGLIHLCGISCRIPKACSQLPFSHTAIAEVKLTTFGLIHL